MKLALVTHRFVPGDGQGRVNYQIARRALERGHHVTLLATDVAPDLRAHPAAAWVPIPVDGLPTEIARNLLFARRSARWLRRHRSEIDALHVNGAITWEPGDVNAAHFVHSAWAKSPVHTARLNRSPYGAYQWAYTALNSFWERGAYQRARRVVAVSAQVRGELSEIGVSPERSQVIVNGVDLQEFRPGPNGHPYNAESRQALGLPSRVPLALFAGDIRTPRKNLDTVLQALAEAPSVHLAVVGALEGSPYPALARQLGVSERAHFLGYRRDIADLMRAADLFVFPSRYEACSLVILEALASGLPVITARTAGGSEIVTAEAGIVLDDPNDATALAGVVCRMTGDVPLRHDMGRAARAVAEQHSWDRMADRYLDLYQDLAGASL